MNIVNTRGRAAIWGAVTLVTAALAPVQPAVANNLTNISSVDAIDFTFAAGGEMFTGGILNATDDAWLVFSASLGDNISINFSSNSFGYVGVVYQDTGDGVVQIGDGMNVSNFNINNVGLGSPLTILNPSIGSNALCCYQFASGASSNTFNFVAPTTGDRNGPTNLDSAVSEIFLGFQAANSGAAWPKYTASGVRRSSALCRRLAL